MNKRMMIGALAIAFAASMSGCNEHAQYDAQHQAGEKPPLPDARNFFAPPMQVPEYVGWRNGATPKVAEGLRIEKIASGLVHPRQVYALPNGDVLVAESNSPNEEAVTTPKQLIAGLIASKSGKKAKGANRITLLRKSASGEWERHVFIDQLHSPFGMQLIGDTLYVADTDAILKFPYKTGETSIAERGVELADLPDTINHHWTKALLASPDGKKLYVGVGSNSNVGENGLEVEYRRADVLEVDTATGASRIYAAGIRNPTGLQWEPKSKQLWAIANERDEIGADLVPDYLTSVKENAFYGWPYSYYGQHVDPRAQPQRPDLVARAIPPDYAIGSHVAPLGLAFYTGDNLPAQYRGGAFIGEHGSWDRSPLSGYVVSYVAFENGKPVGAPKDVVTGFTSADQKELYGAPVGVAQDRDGGLLIADDVGNVVWRVTGTGG
ncbi:MULTISPECIES: sorbosone dehydrogenase family protein [Caballeronia]|uniref:L-sorbosone dehydrogenase n=1 Tax=Caballeronia zhejiangensis TaxID=871203 RepID=A0A656QBU4_9BURK|nr:MULTISPECIES: sorbosone dehydrogenase family protein [Caballeronia]EKS71587.1 L-sorbosone dehydrogenase [Burkholderia sp. SJ98]KDR26446.1 L-sorbosone dehydrogenase [Caballeronia zhejiangensis]MDR5790590.1 sorbosone dehydrogenase family protein [Caballeronia sp. LP003]